jgi:D-threo-aldose 1-dehydrogenase
MAKATERRRFGRSGLEVTVLGFGAATIGNLFRPVPEETAQAMIDTAWDHGVRLFDTAPSYGNAISEYRVGANLRNRLRSEYVLSTKMGYLLEPVDPAPGEVGSWVEPGAFETVYDYGYDGAIRSVEDSLQRMGIGRIDIVFVHDTDPFMMPGFWREKFEEALAPKTGAAAALTRLRDEGVIGAWGFGVNHWEVCHEAAQRADLDCFLLAGRYTLLDQEVLDDFLPLCEQRDIAIMLGGGYNGGILATGAVPGAKYQYAPAPEEIMERVRKMEAVCERHGVPLPAAALQFPIAHPAVPTIIPGGRRVEQFLGSIELINHPIPADFWAEMKAEGLIREDAPTPD